MSLDDLTRGRLLMDLRLELVLIPVSDVDRAKAFYSEVLQEVPRRKQEA